MRAADQWLCWLQHQRCGCNVAAAFVPTESRFTAPQVAIHYVRMKCVFVVGRRRSESVEPRGIGFILGEQQLVSPRTVQCVIAQLPVMSEQYVSRIELLLHIARQANRRAAIVASPLPGISEPERRQLHEWAQRLDRD